MQSGDIGRGHLAPPLRNDRAGLVRLGGKGVKRF